MSNLISANIIADSINTSIVLDNGKHPRLTTFEVIFPRIVLAEFNTHRIFSRNSASSRAIPFKKMVEMVKTNPFIPIKWMKDHKGMQGVEYFTEQELKDSPILERWLEARDAAVVNAEELSYYGLTKQIVNRLLEPFMWHKVLVTATEWENFFSLRAERAAEIHIQDLAYKMLDAYNNSKPNELKEGEYHIPYGDSISSELFDTLNNTEYFEEFYTNPIQTVIKIAIAKCAGVSYTIVGEDGKSDDYIKLLKRTEGLIRMGHMSPTEHIGCAMNNYEYEEHINGLYQHDTSRMYPTPIIEDNAMGWSGNFQGFIQYRKTIEGENRKDNRVK